MHSIILVYRSLVWALLVSIGVSVNTAYSNEPSFPNRPVTLVVAFPPGGGTDIVARKVGIELSKYWNQPVIIDNRAGASGTIGTSYVAKAEPNGYTLFFGTLGNLAINQHIYTTDIVPSRDFSAVTNAVGVTFVLVANNNFPPNNVRELIALGKSKQGPFYYASSGSGGAPHLAIELFKSMTGTNFIHVPYKGSAPSFNDLISGQVQFTMDSLAQALPYIQAGRLKVLAVLGPNRSPLLPNVPTMAESGVPGYDFTNWFGLVAPGNTPSAIVNKIYQDISVVLKQPELNKQLQNMGVEVINNSPTQFSQQLKDESAKWGKIVMESNITK